MTKFRATDPVGYTVQTREGERLTFPHVVPLRDGKEKIVHTDKAPTFEDAQRHIRRNNKLGEWFAVRA